MEILAAALAAYARPPGHDDLTRMNMSGVGREAFAALRPVSEVSGVTVIQRRRFSGYETTSASTSTMSCCGVS